MITMLRTVGQVTAVAVVTLVLGLLTWSVLPAVIGWRPTVVLTGSMAPSILPGDVIVSAPATAVDALPGRVVLVDDPSSPGRLLVHRVLALQADGSLTTKGDANPSPDSLPVPPSSLEGLPRLRVPFAGLPMLWMTEGRWHLLAAGVAGLTLALASTLATLLPSRTVARGRHLAVPGSVEAEG